jgi:uncharacterized protein (TIGR00304 family)
MRMNKFLILAALLIICGIALLGYSVSSGEGSAGVFFIIPVFYGSGIYSFLGVLCIMVGLFLALFGIAAQMEEMEGFEEPSGTQPSRTSGPKPQKSIKGGGVVLIGPIPIIFGSDAKTAMALVLMAIVLIVIVAVFFYI